MTPLLITRIRQAREFHSATNAVSALDLEWPANWDTIGATSATGPIQAVYVLGQGLMLTVRDTYKGRDEHLDRPVRRGLHLWNGRGDGGCGTPSQEDHPTYAMGR